MDAQEERCILYDDTWTVGDKEVSTRLVRVDGAAGLEPVVYILLQFVRGEKCGRVEMMPNPPSGPDADKTATRWAIKQHMEHMLSLCGEAGA